MKAIRVNKREARALLGMLEWCECDFQLGKAQESIREKIYEKFPDLKPNLEKEFVEAEIVSTLAFLCSSPIQPASKG